MGLREYAAMWRHWIDHPPVQVMIAGYLGFKPRPKPGANQDAEIGQMLAIFGINPDQVAAGQPAVIR